MLQEDEKTSGEEQLQEQQQTCIQIFRSEIIQLKWRVLILICFLTYGGFYIYDFPGSIGTGPNDTIQTRFADHNKEFNQEMNQALYTVYSYPNTVLALFGGLLIDKFLGLRKSMLLFAFLDFLGAILFWLGVLAVNYPLIVVGRVTFGLGNESLFVSQSAYLARWFRDGRGLALAFGICVSCSRVGSSFNFLFSPMIAEKYDVQYSCLTGAFCCLLSFVVAIALVALDIYGEKIGLLKQEAKKVGGSFRCSQFKKIPVILWLIWLICLILYCAIFPFIGIAKNFFEVKFGMGEEEASKYVSIYQFTSAGGSPIVGAFVDTIGRFTYFVMLASSLFVLSHLLMLLTMTPPGAIMPLMGICYSILVSSLWPAVPYTVDETLSGLAFGFMTSLQNLGLATFPLIVGGVLDLYVPNNVTNATTLPPTTMGPHNLTTTAHPVNYSLDTNGPVLFGIPDLGKINVTKAPKQPLPTIEGYHIVSGLFILAASIATCFTVLLFMMDRRRGGLLSCSASKRRQMEKDRKAKAGQEQERLLAGDQQAPASMRSQIEMDEDIIVRNRDSSIS